MYALIADMEAMPAPCELAPRLLEYKRAGGALYAARLALLDTQAGEFDHQSYLPLPLAFTNKQSK